MDILIVSFDADPPFKGGVSTVTHTIAKELIKKGNKCTLGYITNSEKPSTFFQNKIKITTDNIQNIIDFSKKQKFDIIITQFLFVNYNLLNILKKENGKIISVYHSKPELRYIPFKKYYQDFLHGKKIKHQIYSLVHLLFFPLFKIIEKRKDYNMFNNAYKYSDNFVVLSKQFFPALKEIIPQAKPPKLTTIGNPLVFDEIYPIENLSEKEKKVLIVCNYNHVKRIPEMLYIWKEIEKDPSLADWSLTFVGGGEGFNKVTALAEKLKLKKIFFTGYTSPFPFYKKGSIILMTSKYEGYPMVLLESLQMGTIPIVYNSFESLSDLITNHYNGIIIPNNDRKAFIKELKNLMLNKKERELLAQNAIKSSIQHSKENVIEKYIQLFKN